MIIRTSDTFKKIMSTTMVKLFFHISLVLIIANISSTHVPIDIDNLQVLSILPKLQND